MDPREKLSAPGRNAVWVFAVVLTLTISRGTLSRAAGAEAVNPPADLSKSIKPSGLLDRNSSIQELIAGLESEEINQWSRATTYLGMRGKDAPLAVPALVKAMERPRVRYSAICALREMGPSAEAATPALIKAITSYPDEHSTRWEASKALANIGSAALPAVKEAIASKEPLLRVWASAALVKSEGPNSPSLRYLADTIKNSDAIAAEALDTIKMLGPLAAPIVQQLKEAMKDSLLPQKDFVEAFARIGSAAEPAMPEVLRALETRDALAKIEAIRAVKSISGPSAAPAVPLLIEALEANDTSDRFTALQQPRIRGEAVAALGAIGLQAKSAIPALLRRLDEPDERARASVVSAIASIDPTNSQALPALIEAMLDPSFRVQYAANAALLKVGPLNIEVIRGFIRAVRENAKSFSADESYNGPSDNIVPVSDAFFYRLGPEHRYAMPDLVDLAREPHPGLQRIAFTGLTQIGEIPEEFAPALIKYLPYHYWAIDALKKMGPKAKAGVPQLLGMMTDNRQRPIAAEVLASIGRPAADAAIPMLESRINQAQFPEISVCRALLKLDPASQVALDGFDKITTMPKPQFRIFHILEAHTRLAQGGRHPEAHIQYLSDKIGDSDERTSAAAVEMIMQCNPQGAARRRALDRIFQLFETSKDESAVEVAARGLEFVGPNDKPRVPQLIHVLSPPRDQRINALVSAMKGLGRIGPDAREALPQLKSMLKLRLPAIRPFEDSNDAGNRATRTIRTAAEESIRKIEAIAP